MRILIVNTNKPFSSISYNTQKFLVSKLNDMVKAGKIVSWFAILHYKEDIDLSDHFHVWVEPNNRVNTVVFCQEFEQKVKGEKLPRKWIDCQSSKFDPWLLYVLHDEQFLALRLLTKKFHYTFDELLCSDEQLKHQRYVAAFHESEFFRDNRFMDYLRQGGTIQDLAKSGYISPSRAFQYLSFSRLYNGDERFRNLHMENPYERSPIPDSQ